MESNEPTQLTSKTETDSRGRADDSQWWRGAGGGGRLGGGGIEQKGKRTHGHGQPLGGGDVRGLNSNGKNTLKSKLKKKCSTCVDCDSDCD